MEIITPDKEILKALDEILRQNAMILEMNSKLSVLLANPPIIMDDSIRPAKPGEIVYENN